MHQIFEIAKGGKEQALMKLRNGFRAERESRAKDVDCIIGRKKKDEKNRCDLIQREDDVNIH